MQNVLLPSIRQRFPDGSVNFIHDNSPIPSVPSHSASLSHGFRSTRKFECHGHQRVPTWTPLRMFGGTWSKKWKATKWRVPKKFLKGPVPFGKDLSAVPNIGANLLHQWAEDWLLFVMHDLCNFVDRVSELTERRKKLIVLKTIDMEIGIYRYKPLYYRYKSLYYRYKPLWLRIRSRLAKRFIFKFLLLYLYFIYHHAVKF